MHDRRRFLTDLVKLSAVPFIPLPYKLLWEDMPPDPKTIIEKVEVIRVSGPYASTPGKNRQHQVQSIHIYPDQKPQTYRDNPNATPVDGRLTHHYLKIVTRGGIEGLYGYIDPETVAPIIKQFSEFLVGKDAMAVEKIWDQLYRWNRHSRAGHYMMALSAVDNALWDIRGRYFEKPVYQLLGGPTREEVRVYGSCLGFSVEKGKAGPQAKQLYNDGFHHQKWFLAYGPGDGNEGLKHSVELVEELRDAVGYQGEIMFDAYMGWDLSFAKAWCKQVEKYKPYWIEEAFPPNRLESFVQLSQSTSVPVATGEHFYNRWETLNYLKAGAIQIVQADPEWCGGVSELVKICHLASTFGAKVLPHGHNIPAALHVVASQSPEVCPLVEYLINHVGYKMHFQKDPLVTSNGIIPLPTRPGFGIELDKSKIETEEVVKA